MKWYFRERSIWREFCTRFAQAIGSFDLWERYCMRFMIVGDLWQYTARSACPGGGFDRRWRWLWGFNSIPLPRGDSLPRKGKWATIPFRNYACYSWDLIAQKVFSLPERIVWNPKSEHIIKSAQELLFVYLPTKRVCGTTVAFRGVDEVGEWSCDCRLD